MHVEGAQQKRRGSGLVTAPSAGECQTKRVETAGVGAKETTCEAGSCFHKFSPLRLLLCLSFSFKTCVTAVKGWETGLAARRLSASLAPLNFSSGTLAHVVAFHASSRPHCLRFCAVLISLGLGFGGFEKRRS